MAFVHKNQILLISQGNGGGYRTILRNYDGEPIDLAGNVLANDARLVAVDSHSSDISGGPVNGIAAASGALWSVGAAGGFNFLSFNPATHWQIRESHQYSAHWFYGKRSAIFEASAGPPVRSYAQVRHQTGVKTNKWGGDVAFVEEDKIAVFHGWHGHERLDHFYHEVEPAYDVPKEGTIRIDAESYWMDKTWRSTSFLVGIIPPVHYRGLNGSVGGIPDTDGESEPFAHMFGFYDNEREYEVEIKSSKTGEKLCDDFTLTTPFFNEALIVPYDYDLNWGESIGIRRNRTFSEEIKNFGTHSEEVFRRVIRAHEVAQDWSKQFDGDHPEVTYTQVSGPPMEILPFDRTASDLIDNPGFFNLHIAEEDGELKLYQAKTPAYKINPHNPIGGEFEGNGDFWILDNGGPGLIDLDTAPYLPAFIAPIFADDTGVISVLPNKGDSEPSIRFLNWQDRGFAIGQATAALVQDRTGSHPLYLHKIDGGTGDRISSVKLERDGKTCYGTWHQGSVKFDVHGNLWVAFTEAGKRVPREQDKPVIGIVDPSNGKFERWWQPPLKGNGTPAEVAIKGMAFVRSAVEGGENASLYPVARRPVGRGKEEGNNQ